MIVCSFTEHKLNQTGAPQQESKWGKLETKVRNNNSPLSPCVCVFLGAANQSFSHRTNKTCSFPLLHDCSTMTPHLSPPTPPPLLLSCCASLWVQDLKDFLSACWLSKKGRKLALVTTLDVWRLQAGPKCPWILVLRVHRSTERFRIQEIVVLHFPESSTTHGTGSDSLGLHFPPKDLPRKRRHNI